MTLTLLKSYFAKQKPRGLNYRNYKFFNNTLFRDQVLNKLSDSKLQISDKDLKHFKKICLSDLITTAPLKSRFIRVNQSRFINNEIQWAVKAKFKENVLKVDPKVTKKHTISEEIMCQLIKEN